MYVYCYSKWQILETNYYPFGEVSNDRSHCRTFEVLEAALKER